jgi:hypothetical protein
MISKIAAEPRSPLNVPCSFPFSIVEAVGANHACIDPKITRGQTGPGATSRAPMRLENRKDRGEVKVPEVASKRVTAGPP